MMASTMVRSRLPSLKKKKMQRRPVEVSVHSIKSKRRKDSLVIPRTNMVVAALYTEDIGTVGVKETKPAGMGPGPILKGPEGQKFQITETAEEKLRRLRRKVRFDEDGGPKKKVKTNPARIQPISMAVATGPDFLSRALSSGRGEEPKPAMSTVPKSQSLVGTNGELEKPYLRLTTYPKAENVRPLEVLIKSLAHIKNRYYQEEDFAWANEQLKSVRQDITVQRLQSRFVLDVYETHGRILLEHGDLAEFNQCQTMIRYLTTTGVDGSDDMGSSSSSSLEGNDTDHSSKQVLQQTEEARDEFLAYHVLYALVQNSWDDLTRALVRVRTLIRERGENSCKTAAGRHSKEVLKSVVHSDYRAFFKLYQSAPHMSAYLMDFLVKRMREKAYQRIIVAYRPTICVEYFRGALCFQDLEETRSFLRQMGAKFVKGEPPLWVDCKASSSSK